jgi:hypothetical protein
MEQLKKSLIKKAQTRYGRIYPCNSKKSLHNCFTRHGRQLILWFNTEDKSTRIIRSFVHTLPISRPTK